VQRWDYLHVDDVVRALMAVATERQAFGVYNLSSGQAVRVRDIVERIRDLIDANLPLGFGEVPYRPDQVMHLQGSSKRLTRETGWRPMVDLESGLARTVAWYRVRQPVCSV
jgi:nucleoside-diphosphate-sugar epimerase